MRLRFLTADGRNGRNGALRNLVVRIGKLFDDTWFWKSARLRARPGQLTSPHKQVARVYSGINRLAKMLASVPLKVVVGDEDDERVLKPEESPIAALFARPNGRTFSRAQLWELYVWQKWLAGGSLWSFTDERGGAISEGQVPSRIVPYAATAIKVLTDEDESEITGYKMDTRKGTPIEWEPHQAAFFRFIDPDHPVTGALPPLLAALSSADADFQAKRWNRALFRNNAEPGGVITFEGTALTEEIEEIKKIWKESHAGADRAHEVAVMPLGAKWQKTSDSHKDMEFLSGLAFAAKEIDLVLGVNKFVLGDVEDLNRATSLTAKALVFENVIIPEMRYIEDVLSMYVQDWGEERIRVRFDESKVEALKQGFSEKLEQADKLLDAGHSVNAVNSRLNLGMRAVPADQGGDTPLVSAGRRPLDLVAAGITAPAPGAASSAPESSGPAGFTQDLGSISRALSRATGEAFDADRFWRQFAARALDPFEAEIGKKMRRLMFELQKETLSNLSGVAGEEGKSTDFATCTRAIHEGDIERILFNSKKSKRRIERVLEPIYERIVEEALSILGEELPGGLKFMRPDDEELLAFLKMKRIRVTRVSDTVRERLRRMLADAISKQKTVQQIADGIRDQFRFARARSLTIARTETGQTSGGARFIGMQREGVPRHRWVTARDDEVRESHEDQDGETREIGKAFTNGLRHPLEVGGPAEEVINCRCAAIPVVDDTEGDGS